jgi:hypothetical protein
MEGVGGGGGFINPSLPSPAPSTALSSTASTATPSRLPQQRAHPLRSGSMKESALINHIDRQILRVNRRHAKKFSSFIDDDDDRTPVQSGEEKAENGYESFREIVRDIEGIVDVVWVSGTRMFFYFYFFILRVIYGCICSDHVFQRHFRSRI